MQRIFYLLILLTVGLWGSGNSHAVEVPEKYDRGIVVVHSSSMAPLSFEGYNREPKGMLVDLWRKWSEKTGVPVFIELMPWKEGLESVIAGEGDVHAGLFWTEERDAVIDFSEGFFSMKTGLIVHKGSPLVGMASLGNSRVGVLDKGSSEEFIRNNYPDVQIVRYPAVIDSVRALVNGELDALYMDYLTVMYMCGTLGAIKDLVLIEVVSEKRLCAGVTKGNVELLELVQSGFDMMSESEIKQVMSRWFVEPQEESNSWLVFLGAVVGFLGVMYFLFFGNPFSASGKPE